jgi:hypothetical protein
VANREELQKALDLLVDAGTLTEEESFNCDLCAAPSAPTPHKPIYGSRTRRFVTDYETLPIEDSSGG